MFTLDPKLLADTHFVIHWPLCQVLLMDDSRYPWLILVPARAAIVEAFELSADDRAQLWHETLALGEFLKRQFQADKVNIGALGNVVSQLHVHVIARMSDDATFPAPVWGNGAAEPYQTSQLNPMLDDLRVRLAEITPCAA